MAYLGYVQLLGWFFHAQDVSIYCIRYLNQFKVKSFIIFCLLIELIEMDSILFDFSTIIFCVVQFNNIGIINRTHPKMHWKVSMSFTRVTDKTDVYCSIT